ncbi:endonuclease VII domain-containing protein [Streptomyces sp. AV19]|uniref:endonuclease VII domain-containing protein n=1 Tax=Streptomyces sp. AV19 TaxID=2793068 RepID=UPI0018FF110D|nr:endonuclease VII domain-containing protein [Streptomyces sp. AV19]MBH1939046.1 endonuclease VII domain-containing protein [Streptomyces sp. AV19]MDG4531607.1 endonuclease VII domain-containing protein [Streptomyces sp. AV19]
MPLASKACRKCGVTKPISGFSLSRRATETAKAVYRSDCKECCSARARQWFADNKERARENRHRWALFNSYGITPDDYLLLLKQQGGVCAICSEDEPNEHGRTGTKFRLAVDHCHRTGRVRGLLCQKCNRAIGLLKDNADLLRKAIDYLERE